MTARENAIGSPRFSPKNVSVPGDTRVWSEPSAPMWACTITRSACSAARATTEAAWDRSTTLLVHSYGLKPSTATVTPSTSVTVIWSRAPVCAMPCSSRAARVLARPSGP